MPGIKFVLFKTFNSFIKPYLSRRDYNGFTLIAVDGTDITSVGNPADVQTFFKSASGGYNLHHVNTFLTLALWAAPTHKAIAVFFCSLQDRGDLRPAVCELRSFLRCAAGDDESCHAGSAFFCQRLCTGF